MLPIYNLRKYKMRSNEQCVYVCGSVRFSEKKMYGFRNYPPGGSRVFFLTLQNNTGNFSHKTLTFLGEQFVRRSSKYLFLLFLFYEYIRAPTIFLLLIMRN